MCNLSSRPGIKPGSPALEGRFLTTAPPGKSSRHFSKHLARVILLAVQTPLATGPVMVVVSWGNWSLLPVPSGMSCSLQILSVPPSWYLLSFSSLSLLTHLLCGLSVPLLDSCSIFLTSCSLKVLPPPSLLNAQSDLPTIKHFCVCLAWTEVSDENFPLALAFYPEHSPVAPVPTFNELPASPCAIVSQPPPLGLPLRSGGYSCSEKVWLLPKPDGSSLPLMAEPWLSVWACLEPFSPGL